MQKNRNVRDGKIEMKRGDTLLSLIIVVISIMVNVSLFFLMYKGVYIPSGKTPFLIGIITVVLYWIVGRFAGEQRSKNLTRTLIFSVSMFIPYSLSSLVYHAWKADKFISSLSVMKIVLFIAMAIVVYLNVVYIRAEISYKRKRENQRIQKEPKKSKFQLWKERKEKEKNKVVSIQLGQSTEADD